MSILAHQLEIVKVRRVGNSNVISLPKALEDLGFAPGTRVLLDPQPDGSVSLRPAETLREEIRRVGREMAAKHREALDLLAAHDRGEPDPGLP